MAAACRLAGHSRQECLLEGDEMIRLLGFLLGSATSIGLILLILGVPDINLSKPVIEDENLEAVSRTVEVAKTDLEAVADEILEEVAAIAEELPPTEPAVEEPAVSQVEQADPPFEEIPTDDVRIPPVPFEHLADMPDDSLAEDDLRWHSFWNPFRSEIAANGFVDQLEEVTGLDYRVVKIKTGVYEVTFAYENDSERRTKLSQIASATGLELPES
jgi:hypothetical protein